MFMPKKSFDDFKEHSQEHVGNDLLCCIQVLKITLAFSLPTDLRKISEKVFDILNLNKILTSWKTLKMFLCQRKK